MIAFYYKILILSNESIAFIRPFFFRNDYSLVIDVEREVGEDF